MLSLGCIHGIIVLRTHTIPTQYVWLKTLFQALAGREPSLFEAIFEYLLFVKGGKATGCFVVD